MTEWGARSTKRPLAPFEDFFVGAGFKQIEKLDKESNFLNVAQREQIRTLFEEGRALEAQALAHSIYDSRDDIGSNGPS